MDTSVILQLMKSSIGMNTSFRDAYLTKVIEGVIDELTLEKGITLSSTDNNHLMFVVDYAAWRFMNKDAEGDMPKHLSFRLKNLYVKAGGATIV